MQQRLSLPCALKSKRFDILLGRFAVDVLRDRRAGQDAQGILKTPWGEIWRTVHRAIFISCGRDGRAARNKLPPPKKLAGSYPRGSRRCCKREAKG